MNNLQMLEELQERIKRKLDNKKRQFDYAGKRGEGYEEACMNILSIIHEFKKKESEIK